MSNRTHSSRSWRQERQTGLSRNTKVFATVCWILIVAALLGVFIWIVFPGAKSTHFVALSVQAGNPRGLPELPLLERDISLLDDKHVAVHESNHAHKALNARTFRAAADYSDNGNMAEAWAELTGEKLSLGSDDTVVFYIAGHGLSVGNRPVLVTSTFTVPGDGMPLSQKSNEDDFIDVDKLLDLISKLEVANKLVLLDASYIVHEERLGVDPNTFIRDLEQVVSRQTDPDLWVITSGSYLEKPRYSGKHRNSLFAMAVAETLAMPDSYQELTVKEIYADILSFVGNRHPESLAGIGQTPLLMRGANGLVSQQDFEGQFAEVVAFHTAINKKRSESDEEEESPKDEDSKEDKETTAGASGGRNRPASRNVSYGSQQDETSKSGDEATKGEEGEAETGNDEVKPDDGTDGSDATANGNEAQKGPDILQLVTRPAPETVGALVDNIVELRDALENRSLQKHGWSPVDFAPHYWRWFSKDLAYGNGLILSLGEEEVLAGSQMGRVRRLQDTETRLRKLLAAMHQLDVDVAVTEGDRGSRHWVDVTLERWSSLPAEQRRTWESQKTELAKGMVAKLHDSHYRCRDYLSLYQSLSEIRGAPGFDPVPLFMQLTSSSAAYLDDDQTLDIDRLRNHLQDVQEKENEVLDDLRALINAIDPGKNESYWENQDIVRVLLDSPLLRHGDVEATGGLLSRSQVMDLQRRMIDRDDPGPVVEQVNYPGNTGQGSAAKVNVGKRVELVLRYYENVCRFGALPQGPYELVVKLNGAPATPHSRLKADLRRAEKQDANGLHWLLTGADPRDAADYDNLDQGSYWGFLDRKLPVPVVATRFSIKPFDSRQQQLKLAPRGAANVTVPLETVGDAFKGKRVKLDVGEFPPNVLRVTVNGKEVESKGSLLVDVKPDVTNLEFGLVALLDRQSAGQSNNTLKFTVHGPYDDASMLSRDGEIKFVLPMAEEVKLFVQDSDVQAGQQIWETERPLGLTDPNALSGSHAQLTLDPIPNKSTHYRFYLETPSPDVKKVTLKLYPIKLGTAQQGRRYSGQFVGVNTLIDSAFAQQIIGRLDDVSTPHLLVSNVSLSPDSRTRVEWADPAAPPPPAEGEPAPEPGPPPSMDFTNGMICVIQDAEIPSRIWYKWIETRPVRPDTFLEVKRIPAGDNPPSRFQINFLQQPGMTWSKGPVQVTARLKTADGERVREILIEDPSKPVEPFALEELELVPDRLGRRVIYFDVDDWRRAFVFDLDQTDLATGRKGAFWEKYHHSIEIDVIAKGAPAEAGGPPLEIRGVDLGDNTLGFEESELTFRVRASAPHEAEESLKAALKLFLNNNLIPTPQMTRNFKLQAKLDSQANVEIVSKVSDYEFPIKLNNAQQSVEAEVRIRSDNDGNSETVAHDFDLTIDNQKPSIRTMQFLDTNGRPIASRTLSIEQGKPVVVEIRADDGQFGSGISAEGVMLGIEGQQKPVGPASGGKIVIDTMKLQPDMTYELEAIVTDRMGHVATNKEFKPNPALENDRLGNLRIKIEEPPETDPDEPMAVMHTVTVLATAGPNNPLRLNDLDDIQASIVLAPGMAALPMQRVKPEADGRTTRFQMKGLKPGEITITVTGKATIRGRKRTYETSIVQVLPEEATDKPIEIKLQAKTELEPE